MTLRTDISGNDLQGGGEHSAQHNEVNTRIIAAEDAHTAHLSDTTGAHAASAVSVTPAGLIVATDVQAALVELDDRATTHEADMALHGGGITLAQVVFTSNWAHPSEAGGYSTITGATIQVTVPMSPLAFDLQAEIPLASTVSTDTMDIRIIDDTGSTFFGARSNTVTGGGLCRLVFPVPYSTWHAPTAGAVKTYHLQARRVAGTGEVTMLVDFGGPYAGGYFRAIQR